MALHAVPGCGEPECTECSRDLPQICERGHHSGIGQDGFYAPYATLDIRGAVRVPDGKPSTPYPHPRIYKLSKDIPNLHKVSRQPRPQ